MSAAQVPQKTTTLSSSVHRDLATAEGEFQMQEMTVGDYLQMLGLYDPARRTFTSDQSLSTYFQRNTIPIEKNPIKRRMLRDLLRGGTVPPVVVYAYDEPGRRPGVADGIQRTDVAVETAKVLHALEKGESPSEYAQEELNEIVKQGQKPLTLDEFLARPFYVELWRKLESDELVRLFMVLNVGQQKVSPRHLLEIIHDNMKDMFREWDIPLMTEKDEKLQPRRRRSKKNSNVVPLLPQTAKPFRFEYLLDGMKAYVEEDPHVKTTTVLQKAVKEDEFVDKTLSARITELGSENCKHDFRWACLELNAALQDKYSDQNSAAHFVIQNSDTFFIPLMAALGAARGQPSIRSAIEDRQAKLIEIIKQGKNADPLQLNDKEQGMFSLQDNIRSNIGRQKRALVYLAWKNFFRQGVYDAGYPIDWKGALHSM